jgi:hypothetical protein
MVFGFINSLNKKIKIDINGFKYWVNWWVNTLGELYCAPNFNDVIVKYSQDFKALNINPKMGNLQQYYDNFNELLNLYQTKKYEI